jgi:diguanylate cyclase (GGDEF)-like protein
MWSNFSIALTTLMLTLLVVFLWAIAVFTSGNSIAMQDVEMHIALRNLFFCLTTFSLLYVTSQLPIRRPIIIKLMVGFGLLFIGAWQELLRTLVDNDWLLVHWLEIVALPGGAAAATLGLYELGKAYQLNRLLLGSYRKIEHSLATVDQLTQLYNRRYFFATCPELMNKLQSDKIPPIIICLRLTNLQEINDTMGYQGGDALLMQTAKQLARHIRSNDIAARLSGRCFAIFLPETQAGDAEEIVKRFLSYMEHVVLNNEGEEVVVKVELGYAICSANPEEGFEDLLRRAKEATTRQN